MNNTQPGTAQSTDSKPAAGMPPGDGQSPAQNGAGGAKNESTGGQKAAGSKADDPPKAVNKTTQTTFIESRLPIGAMVQLTGMEADGGGRNSVHLIGYVDHMSLIVSHPAEAGKIKYVKEGTRYRCCAFSDTGAYIFEANVLSVALTPFPHLHLSFPTVVHSNKVRSAVRIPTEVPATAEFSGAGAAVTCTIKDMSVAGALLISKTAIGEAEQAIRLAFQLPNDDESIQLNVEAVIRNVTTAVDGGSSLFKTGVCFQSIEKSPKRDLELYIYKQRINNG